jgi:hypothetical protein
MPSWKKIIASGSDASFSSATVDTYVSASSFKGSFTGSLFGTSSQALTASYAFTASYLVGAAAAVGFPYTGSAKITGSLEVTGSLNVSGAISAVLANVSQPNFVAYNTTTGLFTYANTGSFTATSASYSATASYSLTASYVNPLRQTVIISGSVQITGSLAITGSVYISGSLILNQNTGSLGISTQTVSTNATSSYTSVFYNYTLASGSNARAGQMIAVWSGSAIQYMDNSTTDIGNTSLVALTASLSSGNVLLTTVLPTAGWTVKTLVNLL